MSEQTDIMPVEDRLPATAQSPIVAMMSDPERVNAIDPVKIGQMMDLFEREQDRMAKLSFNRAFMRVREDVKPIAKRGVNQGVGGSRYALLEDVIAEVEPVLTANGFTMSFSHAAPRLEGHLCLMLTLRHADGHVEQHYWDTPPDTTNRAKTPMQAAASASSYAERHMMLKLFALQTGEDRDGRAGDAHGTVSAEQASQLDALCDEIGYRKDRLCGVYNVASIPEIPANMFKAARNLLEAAKRRAQG